MVDIVFNSPYATVLALSSAPKQFALFHPSLSNCACKQLLHHLAKPLDQLCPLEFIGVG